MIPTKLFHRAFHTPMCPYIYEKLNDGYARVNSWPQRQREDHQKQASSETLVIDNSKMGQPISKTPYMILFY